MPSFRCRVVPQHDDGTTCRHEVTSTGRPLTDDCSGRTRYQAVCDCGWEHQDRPMRVLAAADKAAHDRAHREDAAR
jgi:hypothetical protein